MGKELFTIYINCYDSHAAECDGVKYVQVLFDGEVKGPAFNGKILPGGVDTQTINSDGKGTLSARYIVSGTDESGTPCNMYIDNRGAIGEDMTYPKCYCDSERLRYLKDTELIGRKVNDEEGFRIVVSEK